MNRQHAPGLDEIAGISPLSSDEGSHQVVYSPVDRSDSIARMIEFERKMGHAPVHPAHTQRSSRSMMMLGKELEYHLGSAAHYFFGTKNLAQQGRGAEYAYIGKQFVRAVAKAALVGCLIGGALWYACHDRSAQDTAPPKTTLPAENRYTPMLGEKISRQIK